MKRRTKSLLTIELLLNEAAAFAVAESSHRESTIYGVTDGKRIGTYFEHKFQNMLSTRYEYEQGSSAKGIDFPSIDVDMKVTSINQPQSSSPYNSARQKIYGLGYSLLVFVYEKIDHEGDQTGTLKILHTIFIDASRTADYQTSRGVIDIIERDGNVDDLIGFIGDRNLPIDDVGALRLAEELVQTPPGLGYLTISNALQWRLQYRRAIESAGKIEGIVRVH